MRRTRPRPPRPRAEWELEELWERNAAIRQKAQRGELSPQAFQSMPSQLRFPVEIRGLAPLEGLRAEILFQYLLRLSVVFPEDKRFGDCLSALFDHEIIVSHRGKTAAVSTHRFSRKQRLEYNEQSQSKLLVEVRARMKDGKSPRRACLEVAAAWGIPGNSLVAAAQRLKDLLSIKEIALPEW